MNEAALVLICVKVGAQGSAPLKFWGARGSHPRPCHTPALRIRDGSPHTGPELRQSKLTPAFRDPHVSGVCGFELLFYASPRMCRAVSPAKSPAHFPSVGKLLLFMASVCSSLGRVYSFFCSMVEREGLLGRHL